MSSPKPAPEPIAKRNAAFSPLWLQARLDALTPAKGRRELLLALSGGVDSVALLAALVQLRARRPGALRLRAVHVNHHLQPAAASWARQCRDLCRRLRVGFAVRHVRIVRRRGESLEALARSARYAALKSALRPGEHLVVAHHQDDQLETVLLQLMRGAGVAGLAAMPAAVPFGRGTLLRPLLTISRRALEQWADAQGLPVILDPSNEDLRFDRNYVRHQIVPRLRARWPAAAVVASRSARHLADAQQVLDEVAAADVAAISSVPARGGGSAIAVAVLRSLSPPRRALALRLWLQQATGAMPDAVHLGRVLGELIDARADALPVVAWTGAEVRRYRGHLYALPVAVAGAATDPRRTAAGEWHWRTQPAFELGEAAGLPLGRLRWRRDPRGAVCERCLGTLLHVRQRRGGERLRLRRDGPRRALKTLLQESGVLPWWRAALPLVLSQTRLVAVGDLWIDAGFRALDCTAHPGAPRWRLQWEQAPPIHACEALQASDASARPEGEHLRSRAASRVH